MGSGVSRHKAATRKDLAPSEGLLHDYGGEAGPPPFVETESGIA